MGFFYVDFLLVCLQEDNGRLFLKLDTVHLRQGMVPLVCDYFFGPKESELPSLGSSTATQKVSWCLRVFPALGTLAD